MSESTVDLSPAANAPVVGQIVWHIGGDMARRNTNAAILEKLDGGVATLKWWDENPPFAPGPGWRYQCFSATRITCSREIANMSWVALRDAGWDMS